MEPFELKTHAIGKTQLAEVVSEHVVIRNIEDGIDLVGNVYYQGFDKVMIDQQLITPDFFDLKTKVAGEILQKFANYRVQLFIIGDFSGYNSKSLADFIRESNAGNHVNFLGSVEEVLGKFGG